MSSMTALEKIRAAMAANPFLSQEEALSISGVSRQRLYQIMHKENIRFYKKPKPFTVPAPQKKLDPIFDRMSPHHAACVCEMIVCTDLLLRRFDVYKSVTTSGLCDLVAVDRSSGACIRIEVKTARKTETGRIVHSPTHNNSFDVLALVFGDESIIYIPSLDETN